MNIDPRTLVFINILSTFMMSVSLLSVWRNYFSRILEVRYWAGGIFLQSLGWALYAFRGYIPEFFSIVMANTCIILSIAIFFNVLARFIHFRIHALWAYLPVTVTMLALTYYTFVNPSTIARIIIQSVNSAALMFGCAYILFTQRNRPSSHTFTAIIFAVSALVLISRVFMYGSTIVIPEEQIFAHNIIQDISYISFYVSAVMISFGFILMCNDHYVIENFKTSSISDYNLRTLNEAQRLAHIGNWDWDITTGELTWSDEQYRIFGQDKDSFVLSYKNYLSHLRDTDRENVISLVNNALAGKSKYFVEHEIIRPDGTVRLLQEQGEVICDAQQKPLRLFGTSQDITERKKAEAEIEKINRELNILFNNIDNVFFSADMIRYQTIQMSPASEKVFGYPPKDFYDNPDLWKEMIYPEDLPKMDVYDRLGEGRTIETEHRIIHKDGSIRWINSVVTPTLDKEGRLVRIDGVHRDISERKRVEQLLLQSEDRYRNIVETAQEGIWLIDEKFNTVFVNKKMAEIFEISVEEMIGKPSEFFMDEEDKLKALDALEMRKENSSEIMELRFKTKTGKYIWTSLSTAPVFLSDGKFAGGLAMVTDITERYKASEALQHSERQLKEAQKIARLGNYRYNFKTGIWKCSEVVDELTGLTKEEIMDPASWIALMAPEYKEQYLNDLEDTIVRGQSKFGHYQDYKIIRAHTNEVRWVSITGEIKYDDAGKPDSLFGTIQDITERKKEEELIQLNDQLRNFSGHLQTIREEERTHIAREIHDELGQQLTAIKIETSRLKNKIKMESPETLPKCDDILYMVNNAISTVRKIATELRPGFLNELGIEAALELYSSEFEQRSGIRCTVESNLEEVHFSKEINTSIFRIYQEALTNIMRHAKATEVKVKLQQQDGTLQLDVSDNGVGISNERLHNKTSLGLLGMKERAGMLQGEIVIQALPDNGTLVTLKIPIPS